MRRKPPEIELHPSEWNEDWQPPIGADPLPNEKPHIWQEFRRDQNMLRRDGEPFWGRGWLLLPMVLLLIAVLSFAEINGGPAWLLAITRLFY